ncbi:polysaccharide deacetylase family protein [Streptomyces sp. BV129]|uniref:polysaccharide deacetylase family protein n=1 Tax=Streptomyces sp. BV129 TaxID=2849671 RepID=UPI001C2E0E80|nr:polysaccharide deacetylase family protein [Streptomyces sp. BV129]MBV1946469.1 polysaccharide deacetylase family protein [Streptomyces sp. BV129]
MRRRARPGGGSRAARAVALVSALLLLTGCAQSVDPIERLGKKAAEGVRRSAPAPERAYRRWGLAAPLAAPPRHAARPLATRTLSQAGVVDRVATTDRVVFLTYDDAAVHDRSLTALVGELRLPVTVFTAPDTLGPGRAARLRAAGVTVGGRLPRHPALPGLPRARQRAELCARQDRLAARMGSRPRLLRPRADAYDATTLRAAADCGITTFVRGTGADDPDRLAPGTIIRVTPDDEDDLTGRTARVLREAQGRGLTVGNLRDYL